MGYQLRPTTRSSTIHISGCLPENPPIIDARYLETEYDRNVTSKILDRARTVIAQGPLADLVLEEDSPGPSVSTPEEVVRYSLDTGSGPFHAVGSAAMGPHDDDVVDARLRVRGVEGLRVALAWRAADLILEDARERMGTPERTNAAARTSVGPLAT